ELPEAAAGTDAADARWFPVAALGLTWSGGPVPQRSVAQRPGTTRPLAFDHAQILADGVERARAKLEYTPLATAFVREPFTISELREVYETVWAEKLHAGNFHRKVLSVPGFVESTGDQTESGGPRGGPRAKLYRRGDATLLHPALLPASPAPAETRGPRPARHRWRPPCARPAIVHRASHRARGQPPCARSAIVGTAHRNVPVAPRHTTHRALWPTGTHLLALWPTGTQPTWPCGPQGQNGSA